MKYVEKKSIFKNIDGSLKNGKYIEANGNIYYYKDGKLHSYNDLPSFECPDMFQMWHLQNQLHRENGPALREINGASIIESWYIEGKRHRENGPAIEYADGHKEWWIYGEKYTESEFNNYITKKELNESLNEELSNKQIKSKAKI